MHRISITSLKGWWSSANISPKKVNGSSRFYLHHLKRSVQCTFPRLHVAVSAFELQHRVHTVKLEILLSFVACCKGSFFCPLLEFTKKPACIHGNTCNKLRTKKSLCFGNVHFQTPVLKSWQNFGPVLNQHQHVYWATFHKFKLNGILYIINSLKISQLQCLNYFEFMIRKNYYKFFVFIHFLFYASNNLRIRCWENIAHVASSS